MASMYYVAVDDKMLFSKPHSSDGCIRQIIRFSRWSAGVSTMTAQFIVSVSAALCPSIFVLNADLMVLLWNVDLHVLPNSFQLASCVACGYFHLICRSNCLTLALNAHLMMAQFSHWNSGSRYMRVLWSSIEKFFTFRNIFVELTNDA